MDSAQFWQLIERTRIASKGNVDKQAELLTDELTLLPVEEILEYQRVYERLDRQAQKYDLMEIADLIYGGIGDSGWQDFTAWLIGQGKTVYDNAIANAESLIEIVSLENREKIRAESLMFVAQKAANKKTGTEYDLPLFPFDEAEFSMGGNLWKDASVEEHERRVKEKFPKAWAKFGW